MLSFKLPSNGATGNGFAMPVIDHGIHDRVIQKPGAVYGCWNRGEMAGAYCVETRKYYSNGIYQMVPMWVKHTMSTECRFDMSLTDLKCEGCKHRGSGEKYDKQIREMGK